MSLFALPQRRVMIENNQSASIIISLSEDGELLCVWGGGREKFGRIFKKVETGGSALTAETMARRRGLKGI